MKYINAEKLITEINNRLMSVNLEKSGNFGNHRIWAYNDVKDLITSLQQELPSTPSNLDEAAEKYAFTNWEDNDYHEVPFDPIGYTEKVFKAGAEWMAGQGITEVSRLYKDPNPPHEGLFFGVLPFFSTIEMALNYQEGEEVIVNIRKKQ